MVGGARLQDFATDRAMVMLGCGSAVKLARRCYSLPLNYTLKANKRFGTPFQFSVSYKQLVKCSNWRKIIYLLMIPFESCRRIDSNRLHGTFYQALVKKRSKCYRKYHTPGCTGKEERGVFMKQLLQKMLRIWKAENLFLVVGEGSILGPRVRERFPRDADYIQQEVIAQQEKGEAIESTPELAWAWKGGYGMALKGGWSSGTGYALHWSPDRMYQNR